MIHFRRSAIVLAAAFSIIAGGRVGALEVGASTAGIRLALASPSRGFAIGLELNGNAFKGAEFDSFTIEAALGVRWLAPAWGRFRLGVSSAPYLSFVTFEGSGSYRYLQYFDEGEIGIKAIRLEPEYFLEPALSLFAVLDLLELGMRDDLDADGLYVRILGGRTPSYAPGVVSAGVRWYF